ncbi:hypothetical protein ILYODFUR_011906 [Ilyodon furcidens]|uniref:Secreted protein n=1 Tax=Ilyodon furcidens TaxID=33524 RepID=A0ABV0VEV5_9TELE
MKHQRCKHRMSLTLPCAVTVFCITVRGDPMGDPELTASLLVVGCIGIHQNELESVSQEIDVWVFFLDLLPCGPTLLSSCLFFFSISECVLVVPLIAGEPISSPRELLSCNFYMHPCSNTPKSTG